MLAGPLESYFNIILLFILILLLLISLKVEPKTTFGIDETAVNDFKAVCGDYYTPLFSTNGQKFGHFGNTVYCPGNSSACGLSIKSEKPQGMADDTAVNDVVLYCCYQGGGYY